MSVNIRRAMRDQFLLFNPWVAQWQAVPSCWED